MFRNAQQQIDILIHDLVRKGDLSDREIQIGIACYHIGRVVREQEILYNRKLFEEYENEE